MRINFVSHNKAGSFIFGGSKFYVMTRVLLLLIGLILIASCVPNRKVTYLQHKDINTKILPKDSVVRTHLVDSFKYKIQTNDLLYVRFESLTAKEYNFFSFSSPNLANVSPTNALYNGELVDEKGEIPFPVVGKVHVAGLTIFEIQEKLQQIASQYLDSPLVKVRLINYRFTLLGEVNREGTITLNNNRVSMMEAIGQAGGLGELADRSNVKLVRQLGGKTEVQYINLLDENFVSSPYYYVYQNDVLIVRPLKLKPFKNYFAFDLSLVVSTLSLILVAVTLTRHN